MQKLIVHALAFCLISLPSVGCTGKAGPGNDIQSSEIFLQPFESASDPVGRFTLLPPSVTGLNFDQSVVTEHPQAYLYHGLFACGGIAIGDIDSDGLQDLFIVDGPGVNQLYRQTAPFRFENITVLSGLRDIDQWGAGASFVDIDDDGDLDIYICNYDTQNEVWFNDGTGQFFEDANRYGLGALTSSAMAYFEDYDQDGRLDLYLLTNRTYYPQARPETFAVGLDNQSQAIVERTLQKYFKPVKNSDGKYQLVARGRRNFLLRYTRGTGFSNESAKLGSQPFGHGRSVLWLDYDADDDLDLCVGNDLDDSNWLYRNGGDDTFTNVLGQSSSVLASGLLGNEYGDIDGDGQVDFFVVNRPANQSAAGEKSSVIFLNMNADGNLVENLKIQNVDVSQWIWATRLVDFDLDGDLDLFITTGHVRDFNETEIRHHYESNPKWMMWDHFKDQPAVPEANILLENITDHQTGAIRFVPNQEWNLNHVGMSYAAATADLDNDGDLDLVVANQNDTISVYRNDLNRGNAISVKLVGKKNNRFGIGSRIDVFTKSGKQVRYLAPYSGHLTSNQPIASFGLGDDSQIDRLEVRWPTGILQHFENLPANQMVTISEASNDK